LLLCIWQRWHFWVAADLRICANDTLFHTPFENPPAHLSRILTEPIAKDLTMHRTTLSALTLLNLGAIHECRATADEVRAAALMMCRRITSFPNVACRQTMNLLNQNPTAYVCQSELDMYPDLKTSPY